MNTKFILKILTITGTLLAALATSASKTIELEEEIIKKKNEDSTEDTTEKEEEA